MALAIRWAMACWPGRKRKPAVPDSTCSKATRDAWVNSCGVKADVQAGQGFDVHAAITPPITSTNADEAVTGATCKTRGTIKTASAGYICACEYDSPTPNHSALTLAQAADRTGICVCRPYRPSDAGGSARNPGRRPKQCQYRLHHHSKLARQRNSGARICNARRTGLCCELARPGAARPEVHSGRLHPHFQSPHRSIPPNRPARRTRQHGTARLGLALQRAHGPLFWPCVCPGLGARRRQYP